MLSYRYKPSAPLDRFVEVIWVMESGPAPHKKERLLPDGSVEFVFDLHDGAFPIFSREKLDRCEIFRGNVLCGPHSQPFAIDTSIGTCVAGIHFKPGGARPFVGMPFGELHNAHTGLESLWGRAATNRVREQLLEARSPESKAAVLERALLAATPIPSRHSAVAFALTEFHVSPETRKISEVTEEVGLSPRRFINLFRDEVGLTPKLFCRVRRFQRVLRQISAGQTICWTEIALKCGYFDQAHFIHDFRAFSGINPSAYLSDYQGHVNHVPVNQAHANP
jgi:AraC-like DNA-binding protein